MAMKPKDYTEEDWQIEKRKTQQMENVKGSFICLVQYLSPIYGWWFLTWIIEDGVVAGLIAGFWTIFMIGIFLYIQSTLANTTFFSMTVWERGQRTPVWGLPEIKDHFELPEGTLKTNKHATYVILKDSYFDPCILLHDLPWELEFGNSFERVRMAVKWGLYAIDLADCMGAEVARSELGLRDEDPLPKIYYVGWSGGKAFKTMKEAGVFEPPTKEELRGIPKQLDQYISPKLKEDVRQLRMENEDLRKNEETFEARVERRVEYRLREARKSGGVYDNRGRVEKMGFDTLFKKIIFWGIVFGGGTFGAWVAYTIIMALTS